jgi:hypothetical protein
MAQHSLTAQRSHATVPCRGGPPIELCICDCSGPSITRESNLCEADRALEASHSVSQKSHVLFLRLYRASIWRVAPNTRTLDMIDLLRRFVSWFT